MEIKWYMTGAIMELGQRFDWQEFVERVSEIDNAEPVDAAYRAQVVIDLVESLFRSRISGNSVTSYRSAKTTKTGGSSSAWRTVGGRKSAKPNSVSDAD